MYLLLFIIIYYIILYFIYNSYNHIPINPYISMVQGGCKLVASWLQVDEKL